MKKTVRTHSKDLKGIEKKTSEYKIRKHYNKFSIQHTQYPSTDSTKKNLKLRCFLSIITSLLPILREDHITVNKRRKKLKRK